MVSKIFGYHQFQEKYMVSRYRSEYFPQKSKLFRKLLQKLKEIAKADYIEFSTLKYIHLLLHGANLLNMNDYAKKKCFFFHFFFQKWLANAALS